MLRTAGLPPVESGDGPMTNPPGERELKVEVVDR